MKYFSNILIIIALIALFSCEDVIQVNLNSSNPQMVILGNLTDHYDSVIVSISRTTDYFNPAASTPVDSANVYIVDELDRSHVLKEFAPGKYLNLFSGKSGRTYTLHVQTGTIDYQAVSKMPQPVDLDSIWITKENLGRGWTSIINCSINDPPGIHNYYYIQVLVADFLVQSPGRFILYSDKYFDGAHTTISFSTRRLGIDEPLQSGEIISLQISTIDYSTYEYLRELQSIMDQSILSTSTPANPVNNINNGALGYFSARCVRTKTTIVP